MLESTPLEEEVEHAVDAIANDGATYSLNDPKNKVGHVITSLLSPEGIFGGDVDILQRRNDFFKDFSLKKIFTANIIRIRTKYYQLNY